MSSTQESVSNKQPGTTDQGADDATREHPKSIVIMWIEEALTAAKEITNKLQNEDTIPHLKEYDFEVQMINERWMIRDHSLGWIKWAFLLSFYFLFRSPDLSEPYTQSIMKTIQLGGDTDTNGCIVGGLIGSLVG